MRDSQNVLFDALMVLSLNAPVYGADCDLVINGGRVMDPETKAAAVSNVGIKDGGVAVITKNTIKGKQVIVA